MRLAQESIEADSRRPVVGDQPLRVGADCRVRALGTKRCKNQRDDLVTIVVRLGERREGKVVHASDQSVLTAIGAMRTRIVSLEYLKAGEEAVRSEERR